jgi:hypothetical protein
MSVAAFCIGHHARVPAQMIREIQKPRALQILNHLLTLCPPQKPEVWVDQALVGRILGIHQDTVGRWVRYLVKIGGLISLGYHKDGRRRRYKINLPQTDVLEGSSIEPSSRSNSAKTDDFAGQPPALLPDNLRQIDRTINKEEITRIKEQTVAVDFSKKEFSENEKIALKQKMKTIGVHNQAIDKLIDRYAPEKINDQIEHLMHLLKEGADIQKPGAWLITAVEKNYDLPREIDKQAIAAEHESEARREATTIAQRAKSEMMEGRYDKAKQTALDSLEVAKNDLANEVFKEACEIIERNERIKHARAQAAPALIEQIRKEEEEKKVRELKRWFKSEAQVRNTQLFQKSVEEMLNQRLLAGQFGVCISPDETRI